MATKPTNTLYNHNSTAKPSVISKNLLSGDVKDEDCPWVQVGQLYLSVTITGENSWLPLVALLRSQGHKNFKVFSGRHGDIPNIVDRKGMTLNVFAKEHIDEDNRVRAKALKEFTDITVDIIDTQQSKTDQAKWLQEETQKHLKSNIPVIYAWCYSLFTMCEFSMPAVGDSLKLYEKVEYVNAQNTELNKTIAELVLTYFPWVLKG
ncbi:hypothetical protein A1507_15670 [Methylomonas koyamae]|uniref:Uncharacterized protein n=1 Tax=Methylomonas koyamae TaxID=702114 RepID=A0A177N7U9_9GAMM|nr:hypothetical protein [Methylomonas koyamae]OAI14116.1 hypothetical protein A1507_15670 [Methylomonas koyamae]